ncbi:hypothetical protein SUGI_0510410 [Cryptomeria japonica]|uniref:inositol 3-kinase n=1 Tax=Cryptomeria japonica TaxID=3369 RepID=UPI002408A748|nr:inositol 3-kinase [Cryptomeria japonica]GLJ26446.1 hypothetical protein SUGI_0510410 [Cryptomeria japonica]
MEEENGVAVMEKEKEKRALVVGHYCHDVLKLGSGGEVESLGGSVSYITNILDACRLPSTVVSKVGSDFAYAAATAAHPPSAILAGARTTQFHADFSRGLKERLLRVSNACEPIFPSDIPPVDENNKFLIALAVGVAGEIVPETLKRMVEVAEVVVADIQALIRSIDASDGTVGLRNLCETEFYEVLEERKITYLKASTVEAAYVDIERVRRNTCLIVTNGPAGCTLYLRDRHFHVPAFPAHELDPTGAGDSFIAGFSAGFMQGLPLHYAALMGNYFGSLAVAQIGVPRFTNHHLQRLHDILDRRTKNSIYSFIETDCVHNSTLSDSSAFTLIPKVEDQLLEQELEEKIKNSICVPAEIDCVELLKSSQMEEVDDFQTDLVRVEDKNVGEDLDRRTKDISCIRSQIHPVEFSNSTQGEERGDFLNANTVHPINAIKKFSE